MKKTILTGVLAIAFIIPSHAQILKKLKKKVQTQVERTVVDKAAEETDKSLDKIMHVQLEKSGFPIGMEQVDLSEVPQTYEFDWKYDMKITSKDGDVTMNYFLKKDQPYFGAKLPNTEEMFMVMDPIRKITVMYMGSEANKMIMATKIPEGSLEQTEEYIKNENKLQDINIKEIGNKTILEFNCKGYQTENEDGVYTFYVTTDARISFQNIFNTGKDNMPDSFNPEWLQNGEALMLQMIMEGKKNAKKNITMTCINLEKTFFKIKKADYSN
ncbi:DUF4412 domain-containing protein [Gillisia sp. M10.2A]|uniref:DUF4412 domain-containing protein n=1 Tax=Gillisia lutea TaxID=2909668 RepID=A0ABS9EBZ3_9FLAO|nr:DUF4412 domain-containing protein [Gillisia lutea]MCF4100400.1 DUF4412 domain-containing protein [Gillisia lutea]